eukprot:TRINITY_DN8776_c0_g1_i2.p1 TRINITY_DN8776_c0_g1~~TRINITY_DN8776_c0_g1_i2.p1  ORF type:complete len:100 (-),score=1.52 TRINITY_DN8776_c0_g1_i2:19-318(-)
MYCCYLSGSVRHSVSARATSISITYDKATPVVVAGLFVGFQRECSECFEWREKARREQLLGSACVPLIGLQPWCFNKVAASPTIAWLCAVAVANNCQYF